MMVKISDVTKKFKSKVIIFTILHLICLFGPLFYYIPYGYSTATTVQNSTKMTLCAATCIILLIISLMIEAKNRGGLHKCIMWIFLVGVVICLQQMTQVKTFIYIMCATSVLDEIIFIKLKDYYKEKYKINKEIDKRL